MTLLLGDCLEIMKSMPDKSVDAVITDPPYGIDITKMQLGNGKNKIYRGEAEWDKPLNKQYIDEMIRVANTVILWGGNYYSELLPNSRCWLVWDKHTGDNSFADCELAWTNLDKVIKMFNKSWVGANAKDTRERFHPTQKSIELMEWCIELSKANTVLDPFMGSGTTGVACAKLGRGFTGIEIDTKYFEIAKKRIAEAQQQMRLL